MIMRRVWSILARPVIAECLMLGLLVGAGLAMDRWHPYVMRLMQQMRPDTCGTFFPLLGWNAMVLLVVVFGARLPRTRQRVLSVGFVVLGLLSILASFYTAISSAGWISSPPSGFALFLLNSIWWHVMTFRLANELLWIGLAISVVAGLVRREQAGARTPGLVALSLAAMGLLVLGSLLVILLTPDPRMMLSDWRFYGLIAYFRIELVPVLVSTVSLGIWSLVLLGVRRSRWAALPWLVLGSAFGTFFLFSRHAMRVSDVLRDLHFDFLLRGRGVGYPALVARLLAIGILGIAFAGTLTKGSTCVRTIEGGSLEQQSDLHERF